MDDRDGQGYVQSWIADQARRTQPGSPENDSHAARVTDHARPWRPLDVPFTTQNISTDRTYSPGKRGPETWDRPILGLPSLSETSNGLSPDKCVDKTFNTTHEASINGGRTLGSPALKEGHFSKRLRRKTHDDRYDRDRHKRLKHSHNREATQQKGEHIDEAPRSANRKARPGEAVMKNFKSPYIYVDNITMPQLTKGILDNKIVSRRECVSDLDFNHIPLRDENESTEIEHRNKIREKDERRRMQRLREEAEVFESAFSRNTQLPKTPLEPFGLPISRGQRSPSARIPDHRRPVASSCDAPDALDLSKRSLIGHSSKRPEAVTQSLTSLSYSRLDTSKATSIPPTGSHRESHQVQEQRATSPMQAPIHQNHLQNLIASGMFDFIDKPFEEAMAQRQAVKERPRQDIPDECVDKCTHQPTHKETDEHRRDRPGDGDPTVLHRRLKPFEDPTHTSLETTPGWTTAPRYEREVGFMDRGGHSEAQPTNSDLDQGKDQGLQSMQGSRYQTDSYRHPWQNVREATALEWSPSCTAPPTILVPYRTGNDWAQVDEPCRSRPYVSDHRNRTFSYPRDSPHVMAQILEESSRQISRSPHRSPHQEAHWPLDSQTCLDMGSSQPNNYRRPFDESLEDLVKRIDDEILGEPLLRQGHKGHCDRGNAGFNTPWMSHDVDELPREDLAGFRDVTAPDQPVRNRSSKYDPEFPLDNAEDDLELANFWRPKHF